MMSDFDEMVAGLEDELSAGSDIPDYEAMSNLELINLSHELKAELMSGGVMLEPKTGEDMDKQSTYIGVMSEMRRRNLT